MTERIDHAAEAMKCVEYANSPHPGSPEVAANFMAQAAVHATLALVEQQRIANLIAVNEPVNWEYGRMYFDEAGDPHIRETTDVTSPDGHRADGSPYWNYRPMRRRKAGPWEPVEGESK